MVQTNEASPFLQITVSDVTGTKTLSQLTVPATVSADELARTISSRMNLPESVTYALRHDRTSAYLAPDRPIGEQVEESEPALTITPRAHLG